jgi:hypothetical protein
MARAVLSLACRRAGASVFQGKRPLRSLNDVATLPDQLGACRERPAACCDKAPSIIQHVLGFDIRFVFGPHDQQQTRSFLATVNSAEFRSLSEFQN